MRASRLLTILIRLQSQERVTAGELADRLEVSKRTIYRDMDELSAAGVPVYADRGVGGGFALLHQFRTELTGLTLVESEALLLAGVPAAAADLGLLPALSGAREKILYSLAGPMRESALRVAERFHLDPIEWYQRRRPSPHLETLARCVWESRSARLLYEGWRRTGWSGVDPLGLVLKAGQWYMIARCGGRDRIYNLSAVRQVAVLDDGFERPDDFDLSRAWIDAVQRFERSLHRETATLRVASSAMDRLDRLGAAISEPLRATAADKHGFRRATVPIESVTHAAGLLLGFADEIEVVAPQALREELGRRAALIVGVYARTGK